MPLAKAPCSGRSTQRGPEHIGHLPARVAPQASFTKIFLSTHDGFFLFDIAFMPSSHSWLLRTRVYSLAVYSIIDSESGWFKEFRMVCFAVARAPGAQVWIFWAISLMTAGNSETSLTIRCTKPISMALVILVFSAVSFMALLAAGRLRVQYAMSGRLRRMRP